MNAIVFDTQALLAFYLGEPGADRVEEYLERTVGKKVRGYINVVNLAELYYILCRESKDVAEEKERNLKSFGVKVVPLSDRANLWRKAAEIKASNSVSLADAFAAATAMNLNATLITSTDTEFDLIKNLKIEHVHR